MARFNGVPMNTDKETAVQIARRLVARLKGRIPVVRAYVFGSRVNGSASCESDLDLLIEIKGLTGAHRLIARAAAWEIGMAEDVVISVIVVDAEEFERGRLSGLLLSRTVRTEGIEVAA